MKKFIVTFMAFVLAPLLPSILYGINPAIIFLQEAQSNKLIAIMTLYLGSLYFTFIIGLPSFLLVRFLWRVTWYTALIVGFVDGVLGASIIHYSKVFVRFDLNFVLPYAIYGAITGLAFWLIWKRGSSTTQTKN